NRKLLMPKDSIRRDIFEKLSSSVQFLPDEDSRTCWKSHLSKFNFKALQAEALKNNPAIAKQGLTPHIYTPDLNFGIDFFVVINAGKQMRLASDQIETDGFYRFENPGETIKACDGSILVSGDSKQALTFGDAYPSDHCPILLSIGF